MTRLKSEWLEDMAEKTKSSQQDLVKRIGRNYRNLIDPEGWPLAHSRIAIIPITQGQGIIGNFCQSVAAVIQEMGFEVIITKETDVTGIYEAREKNADILFMADDHRFIAWNLKNGKMMENNHATALGYVCALEAAARGLSDKQVLLLGYGPLGRHGEQLLRGKGAIVAVYDQDIDKQRELFELGMETTTDIQDIKRFKYLLDTTNTGEWLTSDLLHPEAWIAAPGIPLSLDAQAWEKHQHHVIHDVLQIGVASMLRLVI